MRGGSSRRKLLTEGPVGGDILALMAPMALGMIALVMNNVAGAFFIARVSTEQLAAVSFTYPVSFMMAVIGLALGTGTSSVVARLFGAGQRDDLRRITGHAMLLAVVSSVVVLVAGLLTIDPLFRLLGADDNTLPLIRRYMRIYYWGGVFTVTPMIANSVLRALGDAKRPALMLGISAALNIIIDPVLIFGLLGFPRMEIEGAALGAVISNALTLVASVYLVMYGEQLVSLRNFMPRLILDSWRRILHVGLPSLGSGLVAPLTTAFITSQVAIFGQGAVAGFGMAARIEGLVMVAFMALSAAMTPFTGQNFGAGRLDRVRSGVTFAYRFSLFYGIAATLLMYAGSGWLTRLFELETDALEAALLQLRIVPISYAAFGIAMTVNGALNALGKPVAAMFVSMSRTIAVYAPLAWLLSRLLGLPGIFIAAAAANFVAGGVGALWFRSIYRQLRAAFPDQGTATP